MGCPTKSRTRRPARRHTSVKLAAPGALAALALLAAWPTPAGGFHISSTPSLPGSTYDPSAKRRHISCEMRSKIVAGAVWQRPSLGQRECHALGPVDAQGRGNPTARRSCWGGEWHGFLWGRSSPRAGIFLQSLEAAAAENEGVQRARETKEESRERIYAERMARRSQLQGSVSPLERERLKVVSSYSARAAKAVPGGTVCPSCWCKNEVCACMPSARGATEGLHHRVLIYCHYKEYLKLSNTGALLLGILPPGQASLYVCGVPEHDEAFKAELQRSQGSSFVLYPSPESKTFLELTRLRCRRLFDPRTWFLPRARAAPVVAEWTIVLLEGTWQQARKLETLLPDELPRVRLEGGELVARRGVVEGLVSPLRKQPPNTTGRMCTLGAFAALLCEMDADASEGARDQMRRAMESKEKVVAMYRGKSKGGITLLGGEESHEAGEDE